MQSMHFCLISAPNIPRPYKKTLDTKKRIHLNVQKTHYKDTHLKVYIKLN